MSAVNYEDVIEEALLKGLKEKFNIEHTGALLTYLYSRYAVLRGADTIHDAVGFMQFVLRELCIPIDESYEYGKHAVFHGKDEDTIISFAYTDRNSFLNIFDSIEKEFHDCTFVNKHGDAISCAEYLKDIVSDVNRGIRNKYGVYKKSRYNNELQTLFKLQFLNERFCIKNPGEAPDLSIFFNQSESRMSIESLYERYLHAENFDTTNVHSVAEAQVRDYLYLQLDLIEEGLKPMMKEFPTKEGRVDIVAKDKEDNLVVIEIKTENDKRLIWQCMYYPDEVKKKLDVYGDKKVRMLTIAPEYPEFIKKPLARLGYVESFTYTINAFNNVIEEINVTPFQLEDTIIVNEDFEVEVDNKEELDGLINAFVYTRSILDEKCNSIKDGKPLDDVALKLVEMAWKKN